LLTTTSIDSYPTPGFGLAYNSISGFGNTPGFATRRFNGSIASPSAVVSGDNLMAWYIQGSYSGGSLGNGILLQALSTENWNSTSWGSSFVISTTKNATNTFAVAMTFGQNQSCLSPAPLGGIGYGTGAGGTVTQVTSKTTAVTLNKVCGSITTHNAAVGSNVTIQFTLTNSAIAAGDVIVINHISGGSPGYYLVQAAAAAGSATIYVRNTHTAALGEALVLEFAVIKAVTS
jgi:hypothetical protein